MFICANLIEHAFANSQIMRAEAGAIETTQHLCEPFRARCPCLRRAFFADEPLRRVLE
ncbi:hypothetical protein BQ8482_60114 [Mesorhizobium delmotii]|uniref:Uncharacterized protein n=1 Tax=Mesorhizobium delmotii TaxID=1631247 RepID=A0A2P9AVA7_9HYPH|nr:hypothetical protein BQ8482_60114 [Mesorhizobium delmotii]